MKLPLIDIAKNSQARLVLVAQWIFARCSRRVLWACVFYAKFIFHVFSFSDRLIHFCPLLSFPSANAVSSFIPTNIWLRKSASIKPWTSAWKFVWFVGSHCNSPRGRSRAGLSETEVWCKPGSGGSALPEAEEIPLRASGTGFGEVAGRVDVALHAAGSCYIDMLIFVSLSFCT